MSAWSAFRAIVAKDMRTYYLKPPNISWGLIFPFAWMLMFYLRSRTPLDIRGLLPGVISMAILFGTTSMLAVTITFERRSRSFERLLLAPIDLSLLMLAKTGGAILFGVLNALAPILVASFLVDLSGIGWPAVTITFERRSRSFERLLLAPIDLSLLMLAKTGGAILFGALNALAPIVVASFLVDLSGIGWPAVMGSILLVAATSTFLGLFISVAVHEVFEAQTFSNFFRFPMLFLCGLFIPLTHLPVFLRPLSFALPLTYGADILKTAINADGILPLWVSFPVLLLFAVGLFAFSLRNIKRTWVL